MSQPEQYANPANARRRWPRHNGPPRIAVVATGGTISGRAAVRSDPGRYELAAIDIDEMLAALEPELRFHDIAAVQLYDLPQPWGLERFYAIGRVVEQQLLTADAVVVTVGTDVLEELAYWLDLTVQIPAPVVVTGAMRPWNSLSSDAQINLTYAIRLAASGQTRWFGTVAVLNDEIHAARDFTKMHVSQVSAFVSAPGPLGTINGPRVQITRRPLRHGLRPLRRWRTPFDLARIEPGDFVEVGIAYAYAGAGRYAIDGMVDAGVMGIITASASGGGISDGIRAARADAIARGVTFVSTARGRGHVDLEDVGGVGRILGGGDLSPLKARILLSLAFARALPRAAGRWQFAPYYFETYRSPPWPEPPKMSGGPN